MNFIVINLRQEGIHRWADCPFDEVSFLRNYHRHEFHFNIELEVTHEDREVEIIMLKRKLQEFVGGMLLGPTHKSCEMMASDIGNFLKGWVFPSDRYYKVTVLEDGENGGGLIHEKGDK